jgi:hypothetical protein
VKPAAVDREPQAEAAFAIMRHHRCPGLAAFEGREGLRFLCSAVKQEWVDTSGSKPFDRREN